MSNINEFCDRISQTLIRRQQLNEHINPDVHAPDVFMRRY